MSTNTATVETLTAEVRVLQVGNRQVTQSVAKQLDWVPIERIEVFGRVNLNGDRAVIGRDRETGTLVLAKFDPWWQSNHAWAHPDGQNSDGAQALAAMHEAAAEAPLIVLAGLR